MNLSRMVRTMETTERRVLEMVRANIYRVATPAPMYRVNAFVHTSKHPTVFQSARRLTVISLSVVAVCLWYSTLTSHYLISLPVHFMTSHH